MPAAAGSTSVIGGSRHCAGKSWIYSSLPKYWANYEEHPSVHDRPSSTTKKIRNRGVESKQHINKKRRASRTGCTC